MLNNRWIAYPPTQPVIPVIDVLDCHVVRAIRGQREHYQPIRSLLSASPRLHDVIAGMLSLYSFTTMYIADLDAIMGKSWCRDWIEDVLAIHPHLSIWLDAGTRSLELLDWHPRLLPVIGSESLRTLDPLAAIRPETRWILSLDFFAGAPSGPEALFAGSQYWPQRVIIMSLQHVGSYQGPDWATLQRFQQHYPTVHFIAAGGIRDARDVITLMELGIDQCLVASALHDGKITRDDLLALDARQKNTSA